jgi:hypothetical protein
MATNGKFTIEQSRSSVLPNGQVTFTLNPDPSASHDIQWSADDVGNFTPAKPTYPQVSWSAPDAPIEVRITCTITPRPTEDEEGRGRRRRGPGATAPGEGREALILETSVEVTPNAPARDLMGTLSAGVDALKGGLPGRSIRLERQDPFLTPQKALWAIIRDRTKAIAFPNFDKFINAVMCGDERGQAVPEAVRNHVNIDPKGLRYRGTESYEILKRAAEAFLMHETGILPERQLSEFPFDGDAPPEPPSDELAAFLKEERRRLPQYKDEEPAGIGTELAANRKAYLVELEGEQRTFPYFKLIRDRLGEIPLKPPGSATNPCYGLLRSRLAPPILIELIWSYWHEEGMLVQSLKAIGMRFQNRAHNVGPDGKNPLAHLNLDPLRPLSNIFWGYIQDEYQRLSVVRRAYEYDHHYGFTIAGTAVPALNPADSRAGFLAAFHNLLHRSSAFYKEQADTTKVPDGYPLLNALKECHLLLAEGAHNQFGDLPWTARIEMLIEQWLLARPEMREFLSGRIMVPYPEAWMGAADQMKSLQSWPGGSVRHFRDLGVFGEMILLSIRYGNWSDSHVEEEAKEWAQYWRQEVQAYINAYRAVTGVDLSADADLANAELARRRATPPAKLLGRQLAMSIAKLPARAGGS